MKLASDEIVDNWPQLVKLLPVGWEAQARELGALKFGRSFSGPESLLRTLLIYLSGDCSMVETVARAQLGELAKISDVGLLKRINKSGPWLGWITERLIQEEPPKAIQVSVLEGMNLFVVDSSVISAPGAVSSTWRMHYRMNLVTMRCVQAEVTSVKTGESLSLFNIQKGDVILADRGFTNRRGINHVLDSGGEILFRMNLTNLPLQKEDGKPFEQLAHLQSLKVGQIGEWPAFMKGTNGPVKVRVCAYRKTDEQRIKSERKQRKTAQKQQMKTRPETVEAAGYVVVVTTLTSLTATQIMDLYRHRWQVELAFKRMKSILGMSRLRKKDPEGAKAWLQGKLLVACLIERLIALGEHFSPQEDNGKSTKNTASPVPMA